MNLPDEDIFLINHKAIQYQDLNQLPSAAELLSHLLHRIPPTPVPSFPELMTLNNLANIYEKLGNSIKALPLLLRASLFKPSNFKEFSYSVATLMNLSCINSSTGNHKLALKQAFTAVETVESEKIVELKPIVYYNLSNILAMMQKFEKAGFYFGEAFNASKIFLGTHHPITLAASKKLTICMSKFSNRAKNPAFTSHTSKITRYTGRFNEIDEKFDQNVKIHNSRKIVSLHKNEKSMFTKFVGIPYLKELRYNRRFEFSLYTSPKKFESECLSVKKAAKLNTSLYPKEKSVKERIQKIKIGISELEEKLENFIKSSRSAYFECGTIKNPDDFTMQSIVKIQKWFRTHLSRKIL